MKVEDILKAKGGDVVTISPSATVGAAVQRLQLEEVGALVVMQAREIVGLLSERDVVSGLVDHGPDLLSHRVEEVMSRRLHVCASGDDLKSVTVRMTVTRSRHMPVVDDGRLRGIISVGDVVKSRLGELETEVGMMRDAYYARLDALA